MHCLIWDTVNKNGVINLLQMKEGFPSYNYSLKINEMFFP